MIDIEALAETLAESEARIDRQIRLLAELEWNGHTREARMARELLAAITECCDLRLASLRCRAGTVAAGPALPGLPSEPAERPSRRADIGRPGSGPVITPARYRHRRGPPA